MKQKIEDKKTLPDIRKFWKTIDNGDKDITRQQEDRTKVMDNKRNLKKTDDPGKLPVNMFTKNECVTAECNSDVKRVCRIHGCVAKKIVVNTSRHKKDVGFVKKNVSKLRCMGRIRGMESPRFSTVHRTDILPVPGLCRNDSGDNLRVADQGLAVDAHSNSNWRRDRNGTVYSDLIGGEKDSLSALTGDVNTTGLSFD